MVLPIRLGQGWSSLLKHTHLPTPNEKHTGITPVNDRVIQEQSRDTVPNLATGMGAMLSTSNNPAMLQSMPLADDVLKLWQTAQADF
jgi:hypothetical protein